jgi:hypothetical protein
MAWLSDSSSIRFYGPTVRVFRQAKPFEETRLFQREDCRVFQFSLDSTAWRINRVQDYRVSLDRTPYAICLP